jgi:RNA polymerase sigma factor (TIGR02999 family)
MVPTHPSEGFGAGEGASLSPENLFAALYHELHAVAQRRLRGLPFGATLSTTTLLHEAYLSLADNQNLRFPDKARFFSYASRAMRGLIIDYARSRSASKRGGEFQLVPLERVEGTEGSAAEPLSDLGLALDELARLDPALSQLVDLHFFCGLSFGEIAAMRGVSERTVQRDWRKARAVLYQQLRATDTDPSP